MKIRLSKEGASYLLINLIILIFLSVFFSNGGIFIIGLIGTLIVLISANTADQEYWNAILLCTFIAFIWMAFQYFCLIEKFGKPYFAMDDENYEHFAKQFYNSGSYLLNQVPHIREDITNNRGYYWIISWMMRLSENFGKYHTISPRVLNIYLWISVCSLTYKFLRLDDQFFDARQARIVCSILAIFPNALYISSFVYRDTLCIFLMIVIIYNAKTLLMTLESGNMFAVSLKLIGIAIACYILFYTRSKILVLVAGIIAINFLMGGNQSHLALKRILLVMIFALVGLVTLRDELESYMSSYSFYTLYAEGSGSSGGLSSFIFQTPILPFGFILRSIWGMVVPFPGEIFQDNFHLFPAYSAMRLIIYLGTILQIICVPYAIKSFIKLDKNAISWLLTYWMVVLVTFTFRHFIMTYPFLSVEIYYGIKGVRREKITKNSLLILGAIVVLGILYASMQHR